MIDDDLRHDTEGERRKLSRSVSFTDAAPSIQYDHARPKHNEDLTIVEGMEPEPYKHNRL
ncbi:hypothetical protein M378DRAFT_340030 [Amanita muscaria Koide BX008]|uniref:Uncharacterized protein n=1 Tax=Amanita muscaria (strain Koide BX008) TaxID=946122 RepID=A0A0C2SVK8_AMAMK|nr:hypothetical protein M378DRAFT_340030 [Amanita muscaria Koide BX008]